jgi:hypothetical protein
MNAEGKLPGGRFLPKRTSRTGISNGIIAGPSARTAGGARPVEVCRRVVAQCAGIGRSRALLPEGDPAYRAALDAIRASDAAATEAWSAAERIARCVGAELPRPLRRRQGDLLGQSERESTVNVAEASRRIADRDALQGAARIQPCRDWLVMERPWRGHRFSSDHLRIRGERGPTESADWSADSLRYRNPVRLCCGRPKRACGGPRTRDRTP